MAIGATLWSSLVFCAVTSGGCIETARTLVETVHSFRAMAVDDVAVHDERFAAMRSSLPTDAVVGYIDDLEASTAVEQQRRRRWVAEFAGVLHRQLQTGVVEAGAGGAYFALVAERYRLRHRDAAAHTVEAVAANVVELAEAQAHEERLHLVRHALAPVLVLARRDLPLVVGDFAAEFDPAVLAAAARLEVERDFGRGAVLFRSVR